MIKIAQFLVEDQTNLNNVKEMEIFTNICLGKHNGQKVDCNTKMSHNSIDKKRVSFLAYGKKVPDLRVGAWINNLAPSLESFHCIVFFFTLLDTTWSLEELSSLKNFCS